MYFIQVQFEQTFGPAGPAKVLFRISLSSAINLRINKYLSLNLDKLILNTNRVLGVLKNISLDWIYVLRVIRLNRFSLNAETESIYYMKNGDVSNFQI